MLFPGMWTIYLLYYKQISFQWDFVSCSFAVLRRLVLEKAVSNAIGASDL